MATEAGLFNGFVVSSPAETPDAQSIRKIIIANGGKSTDEIQSSTTHIIAAEDPASQSTSLGEQLSFSHDGSVEFVLKDYFTACIEAGCILPVSNFRVTHPLVSTKCLVIRMSDDTRMRIVMKALVGLEKSESLKVEQLHVVSHPSAQDSEELSAFTSIKSLSFASQIKTLPANFNQFTHLEKLSVERMTTRIGPQELPSSLVELNTSISNIPTSMPSLTRLTTLSLNCTWANDDERIDGIPAQLADLPMLQSLFIIKWNETHLRGLDKLTRIAALNISDARCLRSFSEVAKLTNLKSLNISGFRFKDASPLGFLTSLTELTLANCKLQNAAFLRSLSNLHTLDITKCEFGNPFDIFSLEIPKLHAGEKFQRLYDVHRNGIRALPSREDIKRSISSSDATEAAKALRDALLLSSAHGESGKSFLRELIYRTKQNGKSSGRQDEYDYSGDEDEGIYSDDDEEQQVDDESGPTPLTMLVQSHTAVLASNLLIELLEQLVSYTDYDVSLVSSIAEVICGRIDDEQAQIALARCLGQLSSNRSVSRNCIPKLADSCLKQLCGAALVILVTSSEWTNSSYTALFKLFSVAFRKCTGNDINALQKKFAWFVDKALDERLMDDVALLLDDLSSLQGIINSSEFDALLANTRSKIALVRKADDVQGRLRLAQFDDLPAIVADLVELPQKLLYRLWFDISRAVSLVKCSERLVDAQTLSGLLRCVARDEQGLTIILFDYAHRDLSLIKQCCVSAGLQTEQLLYLLGSRIAEAQSDESSSTDILGAVQWYKELANVQTDEEVDSAILVGYLKRNLGSWDSKKFQECLKLILRAPQGYQIPEDAADSIGRSFANDLGQCVADRQLWPFLMQFVGEMDKMRLTGQAKERVLAQLIAVCAQGGDPEGLLITHGHLPANPDEVQWEILAFNGACLFALRREKETMLRWIKRARQLGKPTSQFLSDSDFNFFLTDPDFLSAVNS